MWLGLLNYFVIQVLKKFTLVKTQTLNRCIDTDGCCGNRITTYQVHHLFSEDKRSKDKRTKKTERNNSKKIVQPEDGLPLHEMAYVSTPDTCVPNEEMQTPNYDRSEQPELSTPEVCIQIQTIHSLDVGGNSTEFDEVEEVFPENLIMEKQATKCSADDSEALFSEFASYCDPLMDDDFSDFN